MTEFSDPILAGTTLVRDAIQSENFEAGVAGWRISRNGDAEFNDLIARGDITADQVLVPLDDFDGEVRIRPSFDQPTIQFDQDSYPGVDFPIHGLITSGYGGNGGLINGTLSIRPPTSASAALDGGVAHGPLLNLRSGTADGNTNARVSVTRFNTIDEPIDFFFEGRDGTADFEDMSITTTGMRPEQSAQTTNETAGTSFAGNGVGHSFVAPPSGIVRVDYYFSMGIDASANVERQIWGSFQIREGSTVGSGTVIKTSQTGDAIMHRHKPLGGDSRMGAGASYLLTGLTPGNTYNVETEYRINSTTAAVGTIFVQRVITTPEM